MKTLYDMMNCEEDVIGKVFTVNNTFLALLPEYVLNTRDSWDDISFVEAIKVEEVKHPWTHYVVQLAFLDKNLKQAFTSNNLPVIWKFSEDDKRLRLLTLKEEKKTGRHFLQMSTKEIQKANETRNKCIKCGGYLVPKMMLDSSIKFCNHCQI